MVCVAFLLYTALSLALLASPVKDVLEGTETDAGVKLPRARRRLQRLAAHWPNFAGSCGTSVGLQVTYTDAGLVEENSCYSLCESIASCVAFTVESKDNDVALARGVRNCRLATSCAIELRGKGIRTFVKPSEEEAPALDTVATHTKSRFYSSSKPPENACDFCPDVYGPCYGVPLCRNGQCFRGIPLANGKTCVAASGGIGVCTKGQCTDDYTTDAFDDSSILGEYSLTKGRGCVMPSHTIPGVTAVESCASKCTANGDECAAFSIDPVGSRCLLFPEAKCKMRRKTWTSGIKKQQLTPADALEVLLADS